MGSRLSQYLKSCRKTARLTQHDVAERMNLKSSQYISNVERGNCPPSVLMLQIAATSYADPEEIVKLIVDEAEERIRKQLKAKRLAAS